MRLKYGNKSSFTSLLLQFWVNFWRSFEVENLTEQNLIEQYWQLVCWEPASLEAHNLVVLACFHTTTNCSRRNHLSGSQSASRLQQHWVRHSGMFDKVSSHEPGQNWQRRGTPPCTWGRRDKPEILATSVSLILMECFHSSESWQRRRLRVKAGVEPIASS